MEKAIYSFELKNNIMRSGFREAKESGIMYLGRIGTKLNSSDILNKHTGFVDAWPILCPLMFWKALDDGNG
jgi:hypothetical protein